MLVSYVVTTYNQEETILQTLDSIVNQKMNSDDYEIIVCDDFSKDDTAKVVDKWLKKNEKVNAHLLVPEANQGTVKNLLMGVATCQGQYIMSLAGDDWLVEDSAANMNSYLVKNNPAVVCTNLILYYEAKKEFVCNQLQKNYLDFYKANAKKQNNLLTFHNYVYAPSVYIKTEVFKKIIHRIFQEFVKRLVCNKPTIIVLNITEFLKLFFVYFIHTDYLFSLCLSRVPNEQH